MKRRKFIMVAAGLPALSGIRAALAQPKRPPLIGVLTLGTGTTAMQGAIVFRDELASRGLKSGVQIAIDEVHVGSRYDRLQELAEALAAKRPAVIVATTSGAVAAAAKAAPRTPVVMLIVGDPVGSGFAKSLARPGGMLTGVSNLAPDIASKFVELLLAASPAIRRVGFLIDGGGNPNTRTRDEFQRAATHYAVDAAFAIVSRREEIEPGLQQLAKQGAQALAIHPSPLPTTARKEILEFATAQRWPVIAVTRQWVDAGALLSYGADNNSQWRRAAYYVERILKGAKPADLPIELPSTFEMAVNLRTAKALGLALSSEIMVRANVVIE